MQRSVPAPTPSTRTDMLAHTIVRHPALLLALRVSWFFFIGACLLVAVLGVSALYQALSENGTQTQIPAGYMHLVQNDLFASYVSATIIIAVLCTTIGAVLVYYRASNSWLIWLVSITMLLAAVSGNNLQFFVSSYYPQLQWLAWFLIYFAILVLVMYGWIFPDGYFVPRWLRWLVPVELIWWLITVPLYIDIEMPNETFTILRNLINATISISALVSIGAQIYRFRRASVVERQQLKWAILGLVIYFVLFLVVALGYIYLLPALANPQSQLVAQFLLFPLPNYGVVIATAFLAFAITRYRLYDIDLVINRSLVGLIVTVLLLLVFVVSAFVLQSLLQAENQLLALGLSAIVPALLFNPTRKRVRQFIDRRVYGFRFDISELRAAQKPLEIRNPGVLSGKLLNGYEVRDVLGQGGMGEVYQGIGNGQTVAIKTMLPKIALEPDMRKRFEREAEAGIQLDHPHIAKVYSYGEIEGTPYLIMDYIEGQDLSQLLKVTGKLDEETATHIIRNTCAALDAAHKKGFVHRDLKPANIMIKPNGQAVLMDFGVTKMADVTSTLTGTGAIGTIDYMAPEQIMSSREVDHRADIYALGVMLYELMTGEKPFSGGPAQVMFAHLQQPPPDPRDINDDIPRPIAKAIMQAMSKKPEERFQSAGEFAAALLS